MARTRVDLRGAVLARLGDSEQAIWSSAEIDGYLQDAQTELCRTVRPIVDIAYLENRFEVFVCSCQDELDLLATMPGAAVGAISRITCEDERVLLTANQQVTTPRARMITCPAESELLADISAALLPAVGDVDRDVMTVDRALWDGRVIAGFTPRDARSIDSRYETTAGEVYGLMWQQDGPRTMRKVKRPAAACDTVDVTGSWGLCRNTDEVATSTDTVTGTWGIPRRVPGHHPMGPGHFGTPRRFYLDGKNVRIEVSRQAAPLDTDDAVLELPDRYADYLRDYAMGEALSRPSAGQSPDLATHYQTRWGVRLERVRARLRRVSSQRVSQLGGGTLSRTRPPSPRYPWPYGAVGV